MTDNDNFAEWSTNEILDAYERLDWPDHDVALLIATLQEMKYDD